LGYMSEIIKYNRREKAEGSGRSKKGGDETPRKVTGNKD